MRKLRSGDGKIINYNKKSITMASAAPKVRNAYCYDPSAKKCSWQQVPIPDLPENFIVVKVQAASIHPLDLILASGIPFAGFGMGPGPHILGTEAAGVVIAHGPGKGHAFLGKHVCMMPSHPGVWADHAVVHINDCIIIPDAIPWEAASCAMALPLTACMFLAMAKKMGHRAVVNTAANGQVGRFVNRLLQANGIEVINIVRKADKAAQMAAEGAKYILNSSDADFEKRFVELCMKLHAGLIFECVGGDFFTKIAALAPPGATICHYGSLSGQPTSTIQNSDLLAGKSVIGAGVFQYWGSLPSEEKVRQVDAIVSQISTVFKPNISKVLAFQDIEAALKAYEDNKKGSVDGKIILKW
jgi:NADPH:quinone reductase-like Zn-dependent oxidoreductase